MAKQTPRNPLPAEFMAWQVALRKHTMEKRAGSPHVGVAPLLTVRRPGTELGVVTHSIICGLLPAESQLERKTAEFKALYEDGISEGARHVYDRGLAYLKDYYRAPGDFEADSITTLLPDKLPLVDALRADGRCALVFYVFELGDRDPIERFRCIHVDAQAEVLAKGPVFDNVWWHNTLFHGPADDQVVVHFRHRSSFDTGFGRFDALTR